MIRNLCWLCLISLGLAGCATEPNVYYTLTASTELDKPSSPINSQPAAPTLLYTLSSVSVPAPVDDTLLVVRRSDDQLMKLAHDRWTAPLSKQFSNALAVALTNELGMPPLSSAQASGDSKVATISVDVQRFDLVPGRYAELAAVWQISAAKQKGMAPKSLTCFSRQSQMVEPGVAPLVKAQQQNIAKLAAAIAKGLQSGQLADGTRCQ